MASPAKPQKDRPAIAEVTVPLSSRGALPFFFAVKQAESELRPILTAAAEGDPDTDLLITVTRIAR